MAIARIEPTGISVRKGRVQLRFCFYLNPTDARYEEHHIQVPVIPEEGYPGKMVAGENGTGEKVPLDRDDYDAWFEGLPKKWQNNPFHNHFVRVSPDATDNEIKQLMQNSLDEFYGIWSRGKDIMKVWKAKQEEMGNMSSKNIERCELRGLDIANRALLFEEETQ